MRLCKRIDVLAGQRVWTLYASLCWASCVVLCAVSCEWRETGPSSSSVQSIRYMASLSQTLIGGKPDRSLTAVGGLSNSSSGGTFCTATLIARQVVLTAAHCVRTGTYNTNGAPYFRMELPDSSNANGYRFVYYASQLVSTHAQWRGSISVGYDIAIVILKDKVDPKEATPVPHNRAALDSSYEGKDLWFLGYGAIASGWTYPKVKYGATIPISKMQSDRIIHSAQGKSICFGDSGGPALYQFNGQWRVVGVNSYVTGSCYGTGASTRVDTFKDFVDSYIQKYGEGRSCSSDQDCDPCYVCNIQKICEQGNVQKMASYCKACRTSTDCVGGGTCHQLGDVYRCIQTCSSNSCCPSDSQCQSIGGSSLCLPSANTCPPALCQSDNDCGIGERCGSGVCGKSCQSDADCAQGNLCLQGVCIKPQPRKIGESCENNMPCEQGLRCYAVSGKSICSRACNTAGIGAGSPGSACRSDQTCIFDSQCIPLQSNTGNICLKRCTTTSDCLLGMTCQSVRGSSLYCFCQSDSDCKQNEVCNKAILSDYGACAPLQLGCDTGLVCQDIGNAVTVCIKQSTPNQPCGDGKCDASENCSTCPQDCPCPAGQSCQNGACQPSNSCGNGICEGGRNENCGTCLQDCPCATGESCQNGACKPVRLCGNGTCEASQGENCDTCIQDCACAAGQLCQQGQCVAANHCGNKQCESPFGENCSTCPSDCGCPLTHNCFGGACIPVNSCGNGTCDTAEGENCERCPQDCACETGKTCQQGQCVSQSGCQKDSDCPAGFRCLGGQCQPPIPGGQSEVTGKEAFGPELIVDSSDSSAPPDVSVPELPSTLETNSSEPTASNTEVNATEQATPSDQPTASPGTVDGPCRPDGSCELGLHCSDTFPNQRACLLVPTGSDGLLCHPSKRVIQCSDTLKKCRMLCLQVRAAGCSADPAPAHDLWWFVLLLVGGWFIVGGKPHPDGF